MTRLSIPIDQIKDYYTVVVVGLLGVKDHRENLLFDIARDDTGSALEARISLYCEFRRGKLQASNRKRS